MSFGDRPARINTDPAYVAALERKNARLVAALRHAMTALYSIDVEHEDRDCLACKAIQDVLAEVGRG